SLALSYDDAREILKEKNFELALLDINLSDDKDGVDLAHFINSEVHIPFIFITSYYNSSTVARAKVTQPLAYLLKPFNKHDIQINVEMALYKADHIKENVSIFLREKSGTIQLEINDIVYLEAQSNYTKIVTPSKEIIASQTLKAILSKLPEAQFVRTHKSFATRIDQITMIKGGYVYLNDEKVPIGRSYKDDFQKRISII
ncbi:MAG: response regulator transcription factor, partial [Ekhidna sp.]